jgi:hypothetical protein
MNHKPHNALTVGAVQVREEDGMYSLNDLHLASGGAQRHTPAKFIRLEQAKLLIEQIESFPEVDSNQMPKKASAIRVFNGGTNPGTWACREMVIAYAAWINAAFHLKVIRVFLAQHQRQVTPSTPFLDFNQSQYWVVWQIDGHIYSKTQEAPGDRYMGFWEKLPNIITDPGSILSAELVAAIGQACIQKLTNKVSGLNQTVGMLRDAKSPRSTALARY